MPTVETLLDEAQSRLHDGGAVWPRAELLRYLNDGYRELLAKSQAVRQWRTLDLPGRVAYSVTYEWEARYANGATVRKLSRTALAGSRQATALWEVQALAGAMPTASLGGLTQEWERAFVTSDRHQRVTFPTPHDRLLRLEWDGRVLHPTTVRDLDATEDQWWTHAGRPQWWTVGLGRVRSVEVFEIETTYRESYGYRGDGLGAPREIVGSRTWAVATPVPVANSFAYTTSGEAQALTAYPALAPAGVGVRLTTATDTAGAFATFPWEVQHVDGDTVTTQTTGSPVGTTLFEQTQHGAVSRPLGLGTIRRVSAPDREYWPVITDATGEPLCGVVRVWGSSEDALLALEVVVPATDLAEADTPALIPAPLGKYLRAYICYRAFDRPGEGHASFLADLYRRQFDRGVALLTRLGQVAREDQVYQREPVAVSGGGRRPPRVRFPSNFEQVG